MQRLVNYICSTLLIVLASMQINKQEDTTWQEAMPKEHATFCISAGEPTTTRTIAHLYNECIAMPIQTIGEVPGYHPHHSKPKCLHNTDRNHRYNCQTTIADGFAHHRSPIHHHVIDYYIYTLEHILI